MNNNQPKIKIKICGIKDFKIVDQLLKFNIDFLGLNFIENSKRYIDINTAIDISKKIKQTNKQISLVGLLALITFNYVEMNRWNIQKKLIANPSKLFILRPKIT